MCYIYSVNTIKAHEHVSCAKKKKILVMNNVTRISKAKHITKTVISLCLGKINIDNMKYLKKTSAQSSNTISKNVLYHIKQINVYVENVIKVKVIIYAGG